MKWVNCCCNLNLFCMPQFLILANDHTDADALARRMTFREQHLNRVRSEKPKGNFIIGGAKLNEAGQMVGSMMVVEFPDIEAVYRWLSEDTYVKDKVWESYEVISFRVANV